MPLSLCQNSLRILPAKRSASLITKVINGPLTALALTLWVHRHRLQALLNVHAILCQKQFKIGWAKEHKSSLSILVPEPQYLVDEPFHLVHFYRSLDHALRNLHIVGQHGATSPAKGTPFQCILLLLLESRLLGLILCFLHLFVHLSALLLQLVIIFLPGCRGSRQGELERRLELLHVQLLVRIRLNLRLLLLLLVVLGAGWDAKLGEMTLGLERRLMGMRVRHPDPNHGLAQAFFCLEDILDLTLKLEKVILTQLDLFILKSDCLLNYYFEIHDNFFIISLSILV